MKIQFLSLDSNVWPHNFSQTILIDKLKSLGAELTRVFCNGFLSGSCIPLSELEQSGRLSKSDLKKLCDACQNRSSLVTKKTSTHSVYLDDYLDSELFSDYLSQLNCVDEENWFNFTIDEILVGRIAAYEFFLKHKISDLVIPSQLFIEYRENLQNTLKVVASVHNIISDTSPDVVISYNASYSFNNAYSQFAKHYGVRTYSIQGGSHIIERGKTLSLYESTKDLIGVPFSKDWQKAKSKFPSVSDVQKSLEHFAGLVSGESPWAYSGSLERRNPKIKLGINNDSYTILALTSSEDEVFAAKMIDLLPENSLPNAFSSQLDFVQCVLEIASVKTEWNFIIRLHPRLLPNKRDDKTALGLKHLYKLLEAKSENVYVNYPTDEISIYDLYANVDVGLNYRSSAGYEMMACGIPVVTCISKDYIPGPIDGMQYGESVGEVLNLLETAMRTGPNLENAVIAYRWWGFLFNKCARPIAVESPVSVTKLRPKKSKSMIKIWRYLVRILQLYFPMIRERLDLKHLNSNFVDDRFTEVLEKGLVGLSACADTAQGDEDSDLNHSKRVMTQIRLMIGLQPLHN